MVALSLDAKRILDQIESPIVGGGGVNDKFFDALEGTGLATEKTILEVRDAIANKSTEFWKDQDEKDQQRRHSLSLEVSQKCDEKDYEGILSLLGSGEGTIESDAQERVVDTLIESENCVLLIRTFGYIHRFNHEQSSRVMDYVIANASPTELVNAYVAVQKAFLEVGKLRTRLFESASIPDLLSAIKRLPQIDHELMGKLRETPEGTGAYIVAMNNDKDGGLLLRYAYYMALRSTKWLDVLDLTELDLDQLKDDPRIPEGAVIGRLLIIKRQIDQARVGASETQEGD